MTSLCSSAPHRTADSGFLVLRLCRECKKCPLQRQPRRLQVSALQKGSSPGSAVREHISKFHFWIIGWARVFRTYLVSSHLPPSYLYTSPSLFFPVTHTTNNWIQISYETAMEGKAGQNPNPCMSTPLPPSSHLPLGWRLLSMIWIGTHVCFLLPPHVPEWAVSLKWSVSLLCSFVSVPRSFGGTATSVFSL